MKDRLVDVNEASIITRFSVTSLNAYRTRNKSKCHHGFWYGPKYIKNEKGKIMYSVKELKRWIKDFDKERLERDIFFKTKQKVRDYIRSEQTEKNKVREDEPIHVLSK